MISIHSLACLVGATAGTVKKYLDRSEFSNIPMLRENRTLFIQSNDTLVRRLQQLINKKNNRKG